jgi:hypothetical protein
VCSCSALLPAQQILYDQSTEFAFVHLTSHYHTLEKDITAQAMCRSYYEMKAALGVQPASRFEKHLCPNAHCSHLFSHLARSEWSKPEHRDSVCTHCKHGRRFLDRPGPPQPSKRYVIHLKCLCTPDHGFRIWNFPETIVPCKRCNPGVPWSQ